MDFQNLEYEIDKELEQEILFSAIEENLEKERKKTLKNSRKKKKSNKYRTSTVTTLKSGLKIRTVLLLILTLLVNTYAWFIYISTVSMSISMHVRNWQFELYSGDQTERFEFIVDEIYPGMTEAVQQITANNSGETDADLTCDVTYMNILGTEYSVGDTYEENGQTLEYTSEKLFELLNSYPFRLEIYIDGELYDGKTIEMPSTEVVTIEFKVNWDYEKGATEAEIEANDQIDTEWGNKAYEYMQTNPDAYSIIIHVDIKATQKDNNVTNP